MEILWKGRLVALERDRFENCRFPWIDDVLTDSCLTSFDETYDEYQGRTALRNIIQVINLKLRHFKERYGPIFMHRGLKEVRNGDW